MRVKFLICRSIGIGVERTVYDTACIVVVYKKGKPKRVPESEGKTLGRIQKRNCGKYDGIEKYVFYLRIISIFCLVIEHVEETFS